MPPHEITPKISIVLPTYNEAGNISALIAAVRKALTSAKIDAYEILFIDDSTDNTPATIAAYQASDPTIRLVHREPYERTGLATAFVRGFREARGEYICCLDSDLQHPPQTIPKLLRALTHGENDIVVASRYLPGGSADGLGSLFRKVISIATKYLAQIVLTPARETTDPGSGFFAFKKSILDGVRLSPSGFKILLEILTRARYSKVSDVPYSFLARENDESKATFMQGIKLLQHLWDLFWTVPSASRFLRFAIVGALGTIVNLSILWGLQELTPMHILSAWLIAVLASIGFNFVLHNVFTFPDNRARNRRQYVEKYLSYAFFSFVTLAVNFIFFSLALSAGAHYLAAALIGILGGLAANFFLSRTVVWGDRPLGESIRALGGILTPSRIMPYVGVLMLSYVLIGLFSAYSFPIALIATVSILLTLQGLFSLFLMIYAWESPERSRAFASPETYARPKHTFTALVPARHEKEVIAHTIRAIDAIDYPTDRKEVIVICTPDDVETIAAAQAEIDRLGNERIRIETYHGAPTNKPRGLNLGLELASHDIVTIFDAEDEPHPDIYNVINTSYQRTGADVIQSGVQLMNQDSNWYSLFNVLEYFFWFKSNLHFFARMQLTPLAGNTVFFKKKILEKVGGWDQNCLTEDADIGIRLSAIGAKIHVVYDKRHVTQEETPPTATSFIKQRTRWNQGFIQILFKGDWKQLPTRRQKALALYILTWPIIQGVLFVYTPVALLLAFVLKMPVLVAIIANLPLYMLGLYLIVYNVGLFEFIRDYQKRYRWYYPALTLIYFYPFQIVLGLSAFRAIFRTAKGYTTWEKTSHTGLHRNVLPA